MSLSERINEDLKSAMMRKDQPALRGLRAVKSAILLALTEKGASKELSEEKEMQLLQKLIKQRRESLEIFEQQGREDLAVTEREEIAVIENYLPRQMSEEEVAQETEKAIAETGAQGMKDMGKVMGMLSKKLAGKADSKMIADMVKQKLQ